MDKLFTTLTIQVEVEAKSAFKGDEVIYDWIDRIAKYDDNSIIPIRWDDIEWTPLVEEE